jgi:hypothetical protein
MLLKYMIIFCSIFFAYISLCVLHNREQLRLTDHELILLKDEFGSINLSNSDDILKIQNKVITNIRHEFLAFDILSIDTILKFKRGLCYDRSILLQKVLIYNNIKIRPVYIFFNQNKPTSYIDFFNPEIESHNVFEAYISNKWVIINTNEIQFKFEDINQYIKQGNKVPASSKFIRHINNRNSKFIPPTFLLDIY